MAHCPDLGVLRRTAQMQGSVAKKMLAVRGVYRQRGAGMPALRCLAWIRKKDFILGANSYTLCAKNGLFRRDDSFYAIDYIDNARKSAES